MLLSSGFDGFSGGPPCLALVVCEPGYSWSLPTFYGGPGNAPCLPRCPVFGWFLVMVVSGDGFG
jgi:hypothetical protein